ncbi:hypothetical protein BWI97_21785 [Siphonobacter sp. BAB-5405]|uniref:hypothetical protein n=1 Tax=Siphonobacter sp. BAB-5405 TaxID=1864825 RepID=UPI000C7FC813|nr:hypothetical protein [Siphonobacter sp. BAB-5405]PMD91455.1 hypothetical protein BWI97_21785 [Siphonobacter sp. BAB-5405]
MLPFQTLFHLLDETIDLIEIKRLDLPDEKDPSQLYYWLLIRDTQIQRLTFVSMTRNETSQERVFEEGLLHFDTEMALYTDLDTLETHRLAVQNPAILSEALGNHIQNYLTAQ